MIKEQSLQRHALPLANVGNGTPSQPVKLYKDDFVQQTHAHFARLRQEQPVAKAKMTRWQTVYLINRYADVVAALKDERIVKNPKAVSAGGRGDGMPWMPKAFEPLLHNMLNMDDPDHRRLRNLVHKAFTPRMIMGLAERIETIANELLDAAIAQERVDLIKAFAMLEDKAAKLPMKKHGNSPL